MMVKCWSIEPEDRPTFKELRSNTSNFIEKMADYLDMNFNPFSDTETAKPFNTPEKDDDVEVEAEVFIQVFPPSIKKSTTTYLVE